MEPCSSSSFLNIKEEKVIDEDSEENSVIKISYIHENVKFKQEPEEQYELIFPELVPMISAVKKTKSDSLDENPNPPKHPRLCCDEFPGFVTTVSL